MSPKRDSDGLELPNFSQVKKLTVMTLSDIRGEHLLVKARMVLAEKNVSLIGKFISLSKQELCC